MQYFLLERNLDDTFFGTKILLRLRSSISLYLCKSSIVVTNTNHIESQRKPECDIEEE